MATTQRTAPSRGPVSARRHRPDVATLTLKSCSSGALAALLGVAIAVIVSVGSWALAPHGEQSSPEGAVRMAAGLWLKAHHVTLTLDTGPLSLTPIGLMLIPMLLLYAGGRQLARSLSPTVPADVARAIAFFSLTYAVIAAIVAGASGGGSVHPSAWGAFVAAGCLAPIFGGLGMLRAAGLVDEAWLRVPYLLRQSLVAATTATATLLAVGAALASLALAIGFPEAIDIYDSLQPDVLGGIVLAILGASFIPNLVIWAVSFTVGVGFPLGVDGSVSPRGIDYGAMPVFPPLASLPPEGKPGVLALLVLVAPLVAGLIAGLVVHRRLIDDRPGLVVGVAGGSGVLTGVMVGALCWLSSGSVASGALSTVGPVPLQVGAVAAIEVGLVAVMTAWETQRRGWNGQLPDVSGRFANVKSWLAKRVGAVSKLSERLPIRR